MAIVQKKIPEINAPHASKRPRRRWKAWITLCIVVAVGIIGFELNKSLSDLTDGTRRNLTAIETHDIAVGYLTGWLAPSTLSHPNADAVDIEKSLTVGIQGVRGYTESDGFHGDGNDWYELKLSPELAVQLRALLPQAPSVRRNQIIVLPLYPPDWWPKTWPASVRCYQKDLTWLVLSDSDDRAWIVNSRT